MTQEEILKKVQELLRAKDAVNSCLNNANTLVDMHELVYWAGEVLRLRKEIIKVL